MKREASGKYGASSMEDPAIQRNNRLIKQKIFADKVGAGFSSIQFLNILFSFTGASFLMIGIINAIKSAINTVASSIVKKEASKGRISTDLMIVSGLFFGFSFLFIALGVSLKWKWLFAISMVAGSAFFVIHGDMFQIFLDRYMRKFKPGIFGGRSAFNGALIMAIAIFISAIIMEQISFAGEYLTLPLIGKTIFYGYLISFEVAAFAFIFSSYLLMRVNVSMIEKEEDGNPDRRGYFEALSSNLRKYCSNKYLFMLALATVMVGSFQAIMNSFVGIYVYNEYQNMWLGGFLNVGLMLALSLIVVVLGPFITGRMNRNLGAVPLFVFGTILMAILPFTIVHNNYFPAVVAANMLSVLGAAMIGSGHNLVAVRLLNEKDRDAYYTSSGLISLIPFILIVSGLSIFAQQSGLIELFRFVWLGIIICLFPIYFLVVIWISKNK